jgi:anhydro-N-acetylmuramic acid kinase
MPTRMVVGCMTGTSIDGLDAALVEVEGVGLSMRATVRKTLSRSLGTLVARLRAIAEQQPVTAGEVAAVMHEFSAAHADAIRELVGGVRPDLVCVHGQTVYHKPPLSWQLMQPAGIARAIGAPVVFDLRAADLAAGGQGAPITPIADAVLFGGGEGDWAVVNLGGFCNVTLGRGGAAAERMGQVRAFDVCACNQLLDAIARKLLRTEFDVDGSAAASGTVDDAALVDLEGVLTAQSGARRSLGTGDETGEWISRFRSRLSGADLAATACEAIGQVIGQQITGADGVVERVLLAGGGVRNRTLVRAIGANCSAVVKTTEAAGIDPMYREAVCFAVLGALTQDRVPITLPAVTGVAAPAPIAGAWVYP